MFQPIKKNKMRKKLLYFTILFAVCCSFYACDHEETPLFAEDPGVYFAQSTYSYSFKDQIGVEKDTIFCTVKILDGLGEPLI